MKYESVYVNPALFPLLRSSVEKPALFELRKKTWLWELFYYLFPSSLRSCKPRPHNYLQIFL